MAPNARPEAQGPQDADARLALGDALQPAVRELLAR
ncbi:hypothetical protein LMG23992_04751 [Cupriavidus laharis]|uniref:Uncharacterized protein n=1 Tax=Cupriavidus laharis TaxID=151654 RepID=A0ABN7ZCK5_9BURK|nr:hypothetical protein LMG23992_04751 [Cupriavidus laharis]